MARILRTSPRKYFTRDAVKGCEIASFWILSLASSHWVSSVWLHSIFRSNAQGLVKVILKKKKGKQKITIDFSYILSRKAVRIAKTAALKIQRISCFICGVRREARAPLGQSCKNFYFYYYFFFIPATLRLDRSTSGSQNLPSVRALITCATQASNHRN